MQLLFSLLILSFPFSIFSLNQEGLYLQRVKLGLSDPTQVLSSWNPRDETPCNWFGIKCDSVTRRVISLDLSHSQLSGHFPIFLCRLTSLVSINFYNNSINSSLPVDFSPCRNLESLVLGQNLLIGSIPESLADLPNLRFLGLEANNLTGEIPVRFGEFRRLQTLLLAGNFLNGTVPVQIGNISTLELLQIAYNSFTPGRIPVEFANLSNVREMWLAGCQFYGSIPAELSRLHKLENLDLSDNKLTGSIPSSFTEFKRIIQIELFSNSLSGSLPVGFSNLTALRRFDASMNELTGAIPNELCELELESFNLYDNRLDGNLPPSIAKSPNLYEFKLFNNTLTGQLPANLGLNSPLKFLDLSYNGFTGEIPPNLCDKGELEDLILISNSFSGKIPASLGNCQSLGRARLKSNRLTGPVPEKFWGLHRVYLMELAGNSLTGKISSSISSAYNLSVLLISDNKFTGEIPSEIGLLSNLIEFSASNNMFSGPIPGSLVNLTMLNRLLLSNNELSGGFPAGIQGLKSLNELNLANNKLSGPIPNEIGNLPVLNYLDLSKNYLSGEIPPELQKLKLNVFNLSDNLLSGELPPQFAKEIYRNSFVGNPGLCGDIEGLCPPTGKSKKSSYLWILQSIFVLAGIVFVVGIVCFYVKYRSYKKSSKGITITKWRSFHKLGFSELEIADCLRDDNVIGSGASGKVYKVVLSNGETVAVKKLTGGGNSVKDEFQVEVETLGKIRHKNIVRLWCCCSAGDCKLLVYEYMPNGSLGDLLHSNKSGLLDWQTRYKIALDSAEGLSYLHHDCVPPIVHRDVKSNNILLDGEFGARVADFGVAKIVQGVNKGIEPMSAIAGSCGYIAPEYAYTLRVNEKSDIYSFGVVILELVTGKRPIDPEFGEKDLVKWVYTTIDQKGVDHVIDPKLDSVLKNEICRVLDVGLRCTSSLPIGRPSMRRVVKMLEEASVDGRSKCSKKDGKLTPYYQEETADQV